MTEERKNSIIKRLKSDTNEKLLERFVWYVQNFNPVDEVRCEDYELVKMELLERMSNNSK